MALTRKLLQSMGIEDAKIDQIIEAHAETVEALKSERDSFKANSDKFAEAQANITKLSEELKTAKQNGSDAAKVQAEFDAYKQRIETEKTNAAKTSAIKTALKAAGVQRDEFAALLMSQIDLNAVEIDGEKVKDTAFIDGLKKTYSGCFATVKESGVDKVTPPSGGSSGNNLDDLDDATYYKTVLQQKG